MADDRSSRLQGDAELLMRLERIEELVQNIAETVLSGDLAAVRETEISRRTLARLSVRQHATLQMLFRGAKNIEISERFGVAPNTVAGNVATLARQFGARGRTQLATKAQLAVASLSDAEYLELSGGLPIDWDLNFASNPMTELFVASSLQS